MTPSGSIRRRRRGFTLIELLVVISIIALLVGILLPALGRARKAANIAVDSSQQRQIMIGVHTYATDNNGYVPLGSAMDGGNFPQLYVKDGDPTTLGRDEEFTPGISYFSIWGQWSNGENGPHGLGVLLPPGDDAGINPVTGQGIFGNYLTIDVLYTPFEKKAEEYEQSHLTAVFPSHWIRRGYFGMELESPWNHDGTNWQFYNGGANSQFFCSYNWRGTDYSWIDDPSDPRDTSHYDPAGSGTGSLVGGTALTTDGVIAGFVYGQTENAKVAGEPMLQNRFPWSMHAEANAIYKSDSTGNDGSPRPTQMGSYVFLGDGSGQYIDDSAWIEACIGPTGRGEHEGWLGGRYPGSRFFAELKYHVLD